MISGFVSAPACCTILGWATITFLGVGLSAAELRPPIDREALVRRHNPVVRSVDPDAPLTAGNGKFAFTCDITGLQTFADYYHRNGVPTETLARWCWVSDENTNNYTLADASRDFVQADGRTVAYPTKQSSPAGDWLRKNPRLHPLAQIRFEYTKVDGTPLAPEDIQEPEQTLDLWTGIITSRFKIEGAPVEVKTACHPEKDTIAIEVTSSLVARSSLGIRVDFARGHDLLMKNTPPLDWNGGDTHFSRPFGIRPSWIEREVGGTRYFVACAPSAFASVPSQPHAFRIVASEGTAQATLAFTINFAIGPEKIGVPPEWVFGASSSFWPEHWRRTAAVDFSGSADPRAHELERRIILSRYLMATQEVADIPPQESGLTCNTWYGKHHTEMIWWHTAHFPLWGDAPALAKNLEWFQSRLPEARALAASRGLRGARWPKMVGPDARESPGGNPLIVWNQPHVVYLCELLYRDQPTPETLAKYRDLVLETSECMDSMLFLDPQRNQYVLGPPLWIAQEIHDQATSQNPSFELAYWRWTLGVAQQWRERLGQPRDPHWDHILAHLSPLPQKDGKYVALESVPDTWDNIASRHDHPTMLAPLGVLPDGPDVDRATMERTLDAVLATWDWETKIWGWDYPMIAMTAARLGRPEVALEILLRDGPNNAYLPNGHVPQRSDVALAPDAPPGARKREIAVYLPANGALLAAVALMVAGWDGCEIEHPGFPRDGSWKIRAEGVRRLP